MILSVYQKGMLPVQLTSISFESDPGPIQIYIDKNMNAKLDTSDMKMSVTLRNKQLYFNKDVFIYLGRNFSGASQVDTEGRLMSSARFTRFDFLKTSFIITVKKNIKVDGLEFFRKYEVVCSLNRIEYNICVDSDNIYMIDNQQYD